MKSLVVLAAILLVLALLLGCAPKAESSATPIQEETLSQPPTIESTPAPEEMPPQPPTIESTPAIEETPAQVETPPPTTTTPTTPTYTPPPTPPVPTTVIVWTTPSAPVTLTVDDAAHSATYTSGGAQVSGYFYKPEGAGPFPAVLVLHGKSGLGEAQRAYASWLASQGYVALAPDYLTPIGVAGGQWGLTDYQNKIDPAREVMGSGLEALKSLSYVAPNRIAVVGFSLGGYFGCIMATRDDVRGVVSYYGAYNGSPVTQWTSRYTFTEVVNEIKAPLLMFHGDADQLVAIALANTAQSLLTSAGKECQYIVYPGAGHSFDWSGTPLYNQQATVDAQQKVIVFFQAKLQ